MASQDSSPPAGPLSGIAILEFAGMGPAPFATMLLADMGARVARIARPGAGRVTALDRNRTTLIADLREAGDRARVLAEIDGADALIESFRPGVMERLGLGPKEVSARNPRLVYGRMTGWGQEGPNTRTAGHDLNYLALSGALSLFGRDGEPPVALPPLVGDMGGGGMFLALGVVAALLSARTTGRGSVVDAAIVDGSAVLYTLLQGLRSTGAHGGPPGSNMLDGGRHFYRTYRCADGQYVAVGAIERQFRQIMLDRLGLADDPLFRDERPQDEPRRHARLEAVFATRSRAAWERLFCDTDACVTPVLSVAEAVAHPTNRARRVFTNSGEYAIPNSAPRIIQNR